MYTRVIVSTFFQRVLAICALCVVFIFGAGVAHADTIGDVGAPVPPAPVLTASPVIITAAGVRSDGPQFVQIYNNSDTIQDIRGWKLSFTAHNATDEVTVELAQFSTWMLPRGYIVVAAQGVVSDADIAYTISPAIAAQLPVLTSRQFKLEAPAEQSIAPALFASTVVWPQWQERNKGTTGKYLETFSTKTGFAQLVGMGSYLPPDDAANIEVLEILANARDCSPLETGFDCGDYIKLHNAGAAPVDLAAYRLRTDSGGMKSSSTNTMNLSGILPPDGYSTIHTKDSGDPLSITNDGGYVWLEDAYGVQVYQPVVAYPDSTYTQGQSWAYSTVTNTWQLMVPAPDEPNYWPPAPPVVVVAPTSTETGLADCGPGKERNPETNRCRTIVSADTTSTLTPCLPGQERNPGTNRCRSIETAAATTLVACAEGQERNPETNRCRSILTAASTTLAPCPAGQERNPDTNRCRKVAAVDAAATTLVKDIAATEQPSSSSWFIASGAVLAAIGYAIYEWRAEITRKVRALKKTA